MITVAGPCSVESPEQIETIAKVVGGIGVTFLRGGVFRAGTYPGPSFGLVNETLIQEFSRAAHDYGMRCVLEVLDYRPEALAIYDKYADAYQVGARQMQNYQLLRLLAKRKRPVFLKRNTGSTVDEWLGAMDHLLTGNLCEPILIERGSSSHMDHVRWDLSISAIPAVHAINPDLAVIVDASHGTGRRDLVAPMTLAGLAAGADGFLCEVHPDPDRSLSDAQQAYPLLDFPKLLTKARSVWDAAK